MRARAFLAAAALSCASCVTFSFDRDLRYVPLSDAAIDGLQPQKASLARCLETLGAPLYVWEYKEDGVALAYGWHKEKNWNVTVSVPITHGYSASASYTDDAAKLRGVVLLFDRDLELEIVRRGFLKSLREELQRRRPAPVDDDDASADARCDARDEAEPGA